MDIKQIVLDLCALSDEQEWFEFSVVNQKKKYYNTNVGNEALPWVIIPKPQLC